MLKRYRLSAKAFKQKFRSATKKLDASYAEFAYDLRSYLIEWLKGAESYDDKTKMVETITLEKFYRMLPDSMRTWMQDKTGADSVHKAADLANEYTSQRGSKKKIGEAFCKREIDRAPQELKWSEHRENELKLNQQERGKTAEKSSSTRIGKERI